MTNTKERTMKKFKIFQDFKAFAIKGNMIDMAVGVIIGGAFGKIVSSIVNDLIMPPLGLLIGGVNFKDLKLVLKPEFVKDGEEMAAVTLNYGNFLQNVFDFLIIAFSVFLFIRLITHLINKKKKESATAPTPPPAPTKDQELLIEIRDLLKEMKNQK
jgi:large conductance mechanosensitive channel